MKLFTHLFERYMSHLGYFEGKRNFPCEQDYIEMPVYCLVRSPSQPQQSTQIFKIAQPAQLKEKGL